MQMCNNSWICGAYLDFFFNFKHAPQKNKYIYRNGLLYFILDFQFIILFYNAFKSNSSECRKVLKKNSFNKTYCMWGNSETKLNLK